MLHVDNSQNCPVKMVPALSRSLLVRRSVAATCRRGFVTTQKCAADHVRIVEVGPRDGLQNEKTSIPADTKAELVRRLARTGLQTIEAGSFVSPKWVPQVNELLEAMAV